MELVIQTSFRGFKPGSPGRVGMVTLKVMDENGNQLGLITGDQLKQQLNAYSFDVIDLKSKLAKEKMSEEE